jgi:hypothetical protein
MNSDLANINDEKREDNIDLVSNDTNDIYIPIDIIYMNNLIDVFKNNTFQLGDTQVGFLLSDNKIQLVVCFPNCDYELYQYTFNIDDPKSTIIYNVLKSYDVKKIAKIFITDKVLKCLIPLMQIEWILNLSKIDITLSDKFAIAKDHIKILQNEKDQLLLKEFKNAKDSSEHFDIFDNNFI